MLLLLFGKIRNAAAGDDGRGLSPPRLTSLGSLASGTYRACRIQYDDTALHCLLFLLDNVLLNDVLLITTVSVCHIVL